MKLDGEVTGGSGSSEAWLLRLDEEGAQPPPWWLDPGGLDPIKRDTFARAGKKTKGSLTTEG